MKVRNTFIIFLVSGLWHGANWTFVIWGLLNALYFIPLLLFNRNRSHLDTVAGGSRLPSLGELLRMTATFALITLSWVFFRAENLHHAFAYLGGMLSGDLLTVPNFPGIRDAGTTLILIILFLAVEWQGRTDQYALESIGDRLPSLPRYLTYYLLVGAIFWFGGKEQAFIYFQF